MNRNDVVEWIKNSKGKIFRVEFIKRSTKEIRGMSAQYGVQTGKKGATGNGPAYSPEAKGLICVWDTQKQEYRSIPIEGILRIKIKKIWYQVEG